jgi:hypothetical protein
VNAGGLVAAAAAVMWGVSCTSASCPDASLKVVLPAGHPDINQAQMCVDGHCGTALVLGEEVFGKVPDRTGGRVEVEVLLIVANKAPVTYTGKVDVGSTNGCAVPPNARATADGRIVQSAD